MPTGDWPMIPSRPGTALIVFGGNFGLFAQPRRKINGGTRGGIWRRTLLDELESINDGGLVANK